jgi:hypothetical protein
MQEFLLVAALIGATHIVARSSLFAWLQRFYPPLFKCVQCTGFWIGAAAGGSGLAMVGYGHAIDAIIAGSATSILALTVEGFLVLSLGSLKE